ncbi:MAG TPA: ribonuclease HII [Planktothrix sp.]|jgi:ribonuclease HII
MPKAASRAKTDATAAQMDNLLQLLAFDRRQRFKGRSRTPQCFLVGTDEVGRGCFAGPVVAAAVMLPEIEEQSELAHSLCQLNDSKKLTPTQREKLSDIIHRTAVCAIAHATVEEINEINILHASLMAMNRALAKLSAQIPDTMPVLVLVDGNKAIAGVECRYLQTTVIGGDSASASIAAASIIAKVFRDRLMIDLATQHPVYAWEKNKGYGSRTHREALKEHGMTPWHRRVFCDNLFNGTSYTDMKELNDDECEESVNELVLSR